MKYLFSIIFIFFIFSLPAQCPGGAEVTANDKCIWLDWDTEPSSYPDSIMESSDIYLVETIDSANFIASYKKKGGTGACGAAQKSFTGTIYLLPSGTACTYVNSVLPINFSEFDMSVSGNSLIFTFETISSLGSLSQISLEKSYDQSSWVNVKSIPIFNNKSIFRGDFKTYQEFGLVYYRLAMDEEGTIWYSEALANYAKDLEEVGNAYFHHPSGELRVSGVYLKNVRVLSTMGNLVLDEKVNRHKSFNLNSIQRGLYIVVIDTEEKRFYKKFFKN